jgi:ABC-2 type transport system permease protein
MFGLDLAKQRQLLQLRGRLTIRQFTKEPGKLAGFLVFMVFFMPFSIALGVGTAFAYLNLDPPWPAAIMGFMMVFLWGAWLIVPLLYYRLNEAMDFSRLLVYPLRRRDLVAATLLGTLFDFPTYFTLPILLAIIIGWFSWPILPVLLVATLLGYVMLVLSSQLVLAVSSGILRSRRFRDISVVVLSLLGTSCYFLNYSVRYAADRFDVSMLEIFRPLDYLRWLPPGAAAQAIERAAAGAWLESLLWLAYAAGWTGLIAWAWWRVVSLVATGQVLRFGRGMSSQERAAPPRESRVATPIRSTSPSLGWLQPTIRALFVKELISGWRYPKRRIGLLQGIILPFIFTGAIWLSGNAFPFTDLSPWGAMLLPTYTLLSIWAVAQNMLGYEGAGLQALLLSPVPRHYIFLGKGLGLLVLILLPNILFAFILTYATNSWFGLLAFVVAVGVGCAGIAVNFLISVRFPFPVDLDSATRESAGGGCLTGFVYLLVPVPIVLICVPIAIPYFLAYWQQWEWLAFAAAPWALFYGCMIFWLGAHLAGKQLLAREPEVIAATRRAQGS